MRLQLTRIACLLPLVLTGCFLHKHVAVQNQPPPSIPPPVDETPVAKRETPPAKPATPSPGPADSEPEKTTATTEEEPKPTPKHKKAAPKPAAAPAASTTPAPAQTQQQASNGAPEVSAIGQLSTRGGGDSKEQTQRSLADTERGLNGIRRQLSAQEQKTSAQIREYIKQAKAALESNDLDGAQTLATKAKLLLGELTQ